MISIPIKWGFCSPHLHHSRQYARLVTEGGITHEHTLSIRGMLQVRVRWTDTNINFGKLALWRYLSLIQLDNQRQHSTLYIIYWWRLLHNPSRFPYAIAVSFGSAIAIVSHSFFGLPISRARVLILKHSLDRRIAGSLYCWISGFLAPTRLETHCGKCCWRLSTVDARLRTADCALSSSFFAQASPSPLPLTGIALRNATWNFYAFCIGRAGMRGACWVVRNKKGQSWSRARSSRTLFMCSAYKGKEGVAREGNCNDFFPYDTKNIPINMHATAINNYARDQNRTSPSPSPSSFSPSYSYCFGWSSDCNWNDNQDVYDDRVDWTELSPEFAWVVAWAAWLHWHYSAGKMWVSQVNGGLRPKHCPTVWMAE